MAETPRAVLTFDGGCPDCGARRVVLPTTEPELGDDFAWRARDYDAIRIAMLEELAARFPEHARWTPADLEVVLVEVLAAALDQLHDMADRVSAEAYLETARRPESVRRLLSFIGFDAAAEAGLDDDPKELAGGLLGHEKIERRWTEEPELMEHARRAGPRNVHRQRRMVTLADYTARLEEHPLIRRAAARSRWTGSWRTIEATVILSHLARSLDSELPVETDPKPVIEFHRRLGIPLRPLPPAGTAGSRPTYREVLSPYVERYRLAGQEVHLLDAVPVGVAIELVVDVSATYYQSEVRRAILETLSSRPGGFFAPGRLRFGEDLHASDIFERLSPLEGVVTVCLTRFKRVGTQYPDHATDGHIRFDGVEIAVCDDDPARPSRGHLRITLRGGRRG